MMQLYHMTNRYELEPLEQRRMLCGDLGDAHAAPIDDHNSDIHAANEVVAVTGEDSVGNIVSAFARDQHGARVLWGESTVIDGARVVTWALVSAVDNEILAAGLTIPLDLIDNQPQQGGSGPHSAIASLQFPAIVQDTTFFNHLELHSNPAGHPFSPFAANPNRYRLPHFDFHFYGIPEDQVRLIPAGPAAPSVPANLLPAGYAPAAQSEAEMGRHSGPATEMTAIDEWRAVMIAGFKPDGSQMHFVEPMITRAKLLEQQDFTLPMPMPSEFGRHTLYPTAFNALFEGNAYHLVFSEFIQTDTAAAATTAPAVNRTAVATPPPHALADLNQQHEEVDDQLVEDILA